MNEAAVALTKGTQHCGLTFASVSSPHTVAYILHGVTRHKHTIGSKLNKLKANSVQAKVLQKDKMEYFVMVHTCNPSSPGAEAGR